MQENRYHRLWPSAFQETDNSVVAAQMLPEASGTGEDVSIYELKWVEIGGVFVPIIVQVCCYF